MLSKVFLAAVGLMYLGLALWCSFYPAMTSDKVGFQLEHGSGQSEFLVIYGGLELGLSLLFLLPLIQPQFLHSSLVACLLIHACLVLFRTVSLFLYSDLEQFTYNLAIGEWVILISSIVCLVWKSGSSKTGVSYT